MTARSFPLRRPPRRLTVGVLVAVGLLVSFVWFGLGGAAPATVGPGATEQGQGADVGEATPTYWVWASTQIWHIPTPVPGAASVTAAIPTLLPVTSASYRINPSTAGNVSVRWSFTESTTGSLATELELRFTDGLSRPAVLETVYLETQATHPTAALTFTLYWDAGSFGPSGVTIQTMQVDVLVCTSVGHCP